MPKFHLQFSALADLFARFEVEADTAEDAARIGREMLERGDDSEAVFELSDNGVDPIIPTIELNHVQDADHNEIIAGNPIGVTELQRAIQRKPHPMIERLAAMTTPTDGVTDEDEESDILADLDDDTLCEAANDLYDLIREAREIVK